MIDDLAELEAMADQLLAGMEPAAIRRLARTMATELRRSQADRIRAQQNPDGTPFAPRRPQASRARRRIDARKGAVRRRAMFSRLRSQRHLKSGVEASGFWVGFTGRVARIARVHQEGRRDKVDARIGNLEAKYPVRELLGATIEDRAFLLDRLIEHVAG